MLTVIGHGKPEESAQFSMLTVITWKDWGFLTVR